jgi:hypothetical protein
MSMLRIQTTRRWRNQPLVREPDLNHRRTLWTTTLWILLAAAPIAAYPWQLAKCVRMTYDVSALRADRERLEKEERRLRVDLASLSSLASVERWLEGRNDLIRPGSSQVVVVTDPTPAKPDTWVARNDGGAVPPR